MFDNFSGKPEIFEQIERFQIIACMQGDDSPPGERRLRTGDNFRFCAFAYDIAGDRQVILKAFNC
jgi:hypothetical protein